MDEQQLATWRERVSADAIGKRIKTLEWCPHDGGYWVLTFTDASEISFSRTMAEIAMGH